MFNPLSLTKNDHLQLNNISNSIKESFICKQVLNFTDAQNSKACRYQLLSILDKKEIWIEAKKDRAHNYQLFYYEKVEELEYDPSFLALIGTQSIGYFSPNSNNEKQIVYNRIPKKGELVMPIKHLISEDELPDNPLEKGYSKDGNENWYFMTKRSEGTLKNFSNKLIKRSWEYKFEQNRLLIEMHSTLKDITIYEGREIERKNIKKMAG